MGQVSSNYVNRQKHPDIYPPGNTIPKHDPLYGFPEGREEKVMIATEDEMYHAKVPLEYRDYCAHKFIDYKRCKADKFPFVWNCSHALHDYHTCQYHEYLDRMKDYERERRLNLREKRIAERAAA